MISTLFSNIFILILILLQLFGPFIFLIIPIKLSAMGIQASAGFIFLFIPSILYAVITKQNFKRAFSIKPISLKNLLLLFVLTIVLQPSMGFLAAVSSLIFPNDVSLFIMQVNEMPLLISLFIVAIAPAICEEIAFRGAFSSGYQNVDIKRAAFMNGLMFGFLHLNGQQFLYAFVMGILFAYIVYITGSIFSSMFVHFIFNASQLILSRLLSTSPTDIEIAQETLGLTDNALVYISIISYGFLTLLTVPLVYIIFKLLIHNNKKEMILEDGDENISDSTIIAKLSSLYSSYKEKVFNWPVVIIMIVYACIVIIPLFTQNLK